MKKVFLFSLSLFLLLGCSLGKKESEPTSTVSTKTNVMEEYTSVPEDNKFYTSEKEDVLKLVKHGTGVLFLGFAECPWCQAYAPYLNEVAEENDLNILYYDVLEDRKENSDFYQELVDILNGSDEAITGYDNDGNPRIYVPLAVFISDGEIIGYDGESNQLSTDDISTEDYWTKERVDALKEKLNGYSQIVKAKQEENNSQGCDINCANDK